MSGGKKKGRWSLKTTNNLTRWHDRLTRTEQRSNPWTECRKHVSFLHYSSALLLLLLFYSPNSILCYLHSNVTPQNFNVKEFNTNITEFIQTLNDPRYSQVDSDYPVEDLVSVVGMVSKSVNDYRYVHILCIYTKKVFYCRKDIFLYPEM